MPYDVPVIDETIVCIVDRENIALAAIVSSYFSDERTYFPLFTFPGVTEGRGPGGDRMDDDYFPQMVGRQAAIELQNVVAHFRGFQTLVLAGLSDAQRSYIDVEKFGCARVLSIAQPEDVDPIMRSIGVEKADTVRCRLDEALHGLFIAKRLSCRLWIADDAESLPPDEGIASGLVVIERTSATAGCVAAVNYAHAIGADVRIVEALPPHAESRSVQLIQRWRDDHEPGAWAELNDAIQTRIGGISFDSCEFVTFFTEGLPYSLLVNTAAPCSYVHLMLQPDHLIVNAILRERGKARLPSAVVFAIEEFYEHDETFWLIEFLARLNYAIRQVIGSEATVEAFDYHAADYPYDLLHISSHGCEVDGSLVVLTFGSREGNNHVVEYDEVLGIARTYDGSGLFNVQHKVLFKSLDGFEWGSEELRRRGLSHMVYVDAMHAIFDNVNVSSRDRMQRERVPGGCVVVCNDGYHMAIFRTIASYGNPIVFNNTCSSWCGTNHFFISGGAVAYIGTHWDVPDQLAIDAAKLFYERAAEVPLIDAIHAVNLRLRGTEDENIYTFWGVHFSTLTIGKSVQRSVNDVGSRMAKLIAMLVRQLGQPLTDEVRENAARALRRVVKDFDDHFGGPSVAAVKARADEVLAKISLARDADNDGAELERER